MIHQAQPLPLTGRGAAFIACFEGYRQSCYDDASGVCTVGYGHVVAWRACTAADYRRWNGHSEGYWRRMLIHDAGFAALAVAEYVHVPLTRYQRDALISFAYNCGGGALNGTDVGRAVNARPRVAGFGRRIRWRRQVQAALSEYVHDAHGDVLSGLVRRRNAEGVLFATGHYSVKQGNRDSALPR